MAVAAGSSQEVVPGLWLGDVSAAKTAASTGVDGRACAILTVGNGMGADVASTLPAECLHTVVDTIDTDSADILGVLPKSFMAIDAALACDTGGGCLVHCYSGVSRSATAVIAWLMACRGMTLDEAMETTRQARPMIRPNSGFMVALRTLQETGGDLEKARAVWDARTHASSTDEAVWFGSQLKGQSAAECAQRHREIAMAANARAAAKRQQREAVSERLDAQTDQVSKLCCTVDVGRDMFV